MPSEAEILEALEMGQALAETTLAQREEDTLERWATLDNLPTMRGGAASTVGSTLATSAGAPTAGVVVAEGDSWFDYPFNDVLKTLEDRHGFDIESVAHRGDTIEEMAYGKGQLEDFVRHFEKLLRRDIRPRAILVSGGGNDIAGKELAVLLNHLASPLPALSQGIIDAVIDERLRTAFITILSSVSTVCQEKLVKPIPILIHGYDYPVPDGRGFLGGWGRLPGPWLEPSFRQKGFENLVERVDIMATLIDRINSMLSEIAGMPAFQHVTYLDLRGTLSAGADYKDWWANELHPTKRGFREIAGRFAEAISQLP